MKTYNILSAKGIITHSLAILIATVYCYTALIKLLDFGKALEEMYNQVFPTIIADELAWIIPAYKLLLIPLLFHARTREFALWASLTFVVVLSIYLVLGQHGVFSKHPCSCIGFLTKKTYGDNMLFNLIFGAIMLIAILVEKEWLPPKIVHFFARKEVAGDNTQ
ncbi:MauE/DoxX family redox-associated membrane protein [Parapedobacter sp.]